MISSGVIIDLSDNTIEVQQIQSKRKAENPRLEHVWIAYYQLEPEYHCVGDFESDRYPYSPHIPTIFDKTILGIFITQNAARECAYDHCIGKGLFGDNGQEDDDDDEDAYGRLRL
jgi:hypothetical protein